MRANTIQRRHWVVRFRAGLLLPAALVLGIVLSFHIVRIAFWFSNPPLLAILLSVNSNFPFLKDRTKMKPSRRTEWRWWRRRNLEWRNRVEGDMLMKELESYVDSTWIIFVLPALELEHLRLEFYNETWVLKTWDTIFQHCFAKLPLRKLLKI